MLPARKIHFEAKKKEKENLRFRSFLKCNADEEELDQQFLQLHKELFETSIAADAVTVVKSTVRNLRQMK